jgi:membrane associated rhomboid family serine protease
MRYVGIDLGKRSILEIMAASFIVYLLQQGKRIWVYLAFTPALATRYPWAIVTSIFPHLDFSHLLFNMFALFLFGSALERRISNRCIPSIQDKLVISSLGHISNI